MLCCLSVSPWQEYADLATVMSGIRLSISQPQSEIRATVLYLQTSEHLLQEFAHTQTSDTEFSSESMMDLL